MNTSKTLALHDSERLLCSVYSATRCVIGALLLTAGLSKLFPLQAVMLTPSIELPALIVGILALVEVGLGWFALQGSRSMTQMCARWWIGWVVVAIGCAEQSEALGVPAKSVSARHDVVASESQRVILTHDFGKLKPLQRVKHSFSINNPSAEDWTFGQILKTCGCTVAKLSSSKISSGTFGTVTIDYIAGDTTNDDQRSTYVTFVEKEAPLVELVVRSHVREPIVAERQLIRFADVTPSVLSKESTEIYNFSDRDWDDLVVDNSASWMSYSTHKLDESKIDHKYVTPRQAWRLTVTLEYDDSTERFRNAELVVRPVGEDDQAKVSVQLSTALPIAVSPPQLFFGTVPKNTRASRTLTLVFPKNSRFESLGDVEFQHTLGAPLSIEPEIVNDRVWRVSAALDVSSVPPGILHGSLAIFPRNEFEKRIEVAVSGKIAE